MLKARRILLVIAGGIAAYKSQELVRLLRRNGVAVRCVLTDAAQHFVTTMALQALTEDKVYTTLWSLTDESEMGHIQLSRSADLVVVAPATADLMARMAAGMANDLASTVLLATDKPVLIAPAMNVRMWEHPATQANLGTLQSRGVQVVGPDEGVMACNEFGRGRMAEPAAILEAITRMLNTATPAEKPTPASTSKPAGTSTLPLSGRHALVTSGPTQEPIDPVRYIANRSSGKQGHAIAAALAALGARVTLVSGPVNEPDPAGVQVVRIMTARQMLAACEAALPADIAVCAAAVADWGVAGAADQKLKKVEGGAPPSITLVPNPDILATLSHHAQRPALVVGFAAETEKVVEHALAKRLRKGCDWIVANDVSGDVMGGTQNRVHLITAAGVEDWPLLPKAAVAERLAERLAMAIATAPPITH